MPEDIATTGAWDPEQYREFAAERAEPFFDLLRMVLPVPEGAVIDLGCGTGELTAQLHAHAHASVTVGVDNSRSMLDRARPFSEGGLSFEPGDIAAFDAVARYDVIFSNAALHWLPDHPALLRRLTTGLKPGGQLAVQVPANRNHPSHAIATELARESPFLESLSGERAIATHDVLAPECYAELLDDLGFAEQHVRLQVYGHHLTSTAAVVEWTKGTMLLQFQRALPPELFESFVERYRQRLTDALGERSPYFYSFKRILFWGRLPAPSTRS